jgi:hypothetical protein
VGRSFLWATHRCEALATYPKVGRTEPARVRNLIRKSSLGLPSYLVLLRVWFALPVALLRRRCALTAPFHPYLDLERYRRYVLCGTFRRTDLNPPSRTLSGTPLCGVRTFLSPRPKTRKATVRSSCQQIHYIRRASGFGLRLSGFGANLRCFISASRTVLLVDLSATGLR